MSPAPEPAGQDTAGQDTAGQDTAGQDTAGGGSKPPRPAPSKRRRRERTSMLLRLDPAVHDELSRWAADELRSTNAHVEWLLRRALGQAGRLPPADGPRRAPGEASEVAPDGTPDERR